MTFFSFGTSSRFVQDCTSRTHEDNQLYHHPWGMRCMRCMRLLTLTFVWIWRFGLSQELWFYWMCIAFGGDRQQSPWAWLGLLRITKCQERLRTNGITVQQKHRGSKRWMNVMLICFSRVQTVRSSLLMLAVFGCIHNLRRNLSRQLLLHFAPALLPDQKRIEGFIDIPHSLSPVLWLKSLIYCRCVPATQCLQEALGVSWCFRPRGGPKDLADWLFIATRNSMDWFFDTMQDVQRHCAQAESLAMGLKCLKWFLESPVSCIKYLENQADQAFGSCQGDQKHACEESGTKCKHLRPKSLLWQIQSVRGIQIV